MEKCSFKFDHYEYCLTLAKKLDYNFCRFDNYEQNTDKLILLRHDIDYPTIEKALTLARIENSLGIQATYFVRLHSNDYNPFGYEFYSVLKTIINLGHEIGLHYEFLDFSRVTGIIIKRIIEKDKKVLEIILDKEIKGLAPHQDWSRIANWKVFLDYDYKQFGFRYEAEELCLKENITRITDSLARWTDNKCICRHISEKKNKLCILTHPFYWHGQHFFIGES